MIVQIRGTSGSGKSTALRKAMEIAATQWNVKWEPVYREGRKQPLYYKADDYNLSVVGHYESPCGGGDTVGSARQVFELIQELCLFKTTLAEGLLLSEDTKWTSQMKDVRIIYLTTSLEQCLANIKSRREAAGNTKELNPKNTENRVAVIERSRIKLLDAGIFCRRASANQAVRIALDWIREDLGK